MKIIVFLGCDNIQSDVSEEYACFITLFLTLTEVSPWFFLSCKANARVKLAKMGHGPHSSKLVVFLCCSVVICVVLCIVCV